ncbi:MAG: M48 metallopeptidase family protein [Candidatus Dormibacterales bacterium]
MVASPRRRRTVQARLVEGVLELRVPQRMPEAERRAWADRMRGRLERRLARLSPQDARLQRRARVLNDRHFGGRLTWTSISFAPQARRWGSCSVAAGAIRVSERAARLPAWVLDYVLVHELAHLLEPGHGPAFWSLVRRYPLAERARGYLMGLEGAAAGPDL